jgi:glycosyltransferase involved in cell wall biosynthesis
MKISVLFPVYKPAHHQLKVAIESIKNQSYKNFECLFLYDAPTDDVTTLLNDIVKSDSRFRVVRAADEGLSHALNLGLDVSDGEFVARMDADDVSLPNRFLQQLRLLDDLNLDIVGGDYYVIDNFGNTIDARLVPKDHSQIGVVMGKTVPFAHSSVMMRRTSMNSFELRYSCDKNVISEDYELWTKMYQRGLKFGNVSDWVLKFRDSDTSLNKRVHSLSIKSARRISNEFISSSIDDLKFYCSHLQPHRLDRVNQEALAFLIYSLAFKKHQFNLLKNLNKITMRNKIVAALAFVNYYI